LLLLYFTLQLYLVFPFADLERELAADLHLPFVELNLYPVLLDPHLRVLLLHFSDCLVTFLGELVCVPIILSDDSIVFFFTAKCRLLLL
jgi:hypothetical protein